MCCVEIIKDNIIAIQTETVNNRKVIDKAIDTYLDVILDIQKDIHNINLSISKLYELLNSAFPDLTKDDYSKIISIYKNLIRNLVRLYNSYRKSNYYAGIKTELKKFKNSIDDLQEISNDMKTFIVDLPQNNSYKNLINTINSL